MILNDKEIIELCESSEMIYPFTPGSVRAIDYRDHSENGTWRQRRILSKGVSSYGYDVSLAEFTRDGTASVKIFTNQNAAIIDPKKLDEGSLIDAVIREDEDRARYVILPPNSYLLGVTDEYFKIPRDVMIICVGKSTYARAGCLCNTTPIEPGFEGNVVIELANATSLPMKIYLHEGIAQFIFFRGKPCDTSYADRAGKYQGQVGVTLPRV